MSSPARISIKDYMICWTGNFECNADNPTRGRVALVKWPDTNHVQSGQLQSSTGACLARIQECKNKKDLEYFVMSEALSLIISYRIDPVEVHRALWPLVEYRNALPVGTNPPSRHE